MLEGEGKEMDGCMGVVLDEVCGRDTWVDGLGWYIACVYIVYVWVGGQKEGGWGWGWGWDGLDSTWKRERE